MSKKDFINDKINVNDIIILDKYIFNGKVLKIDNEILIQPVSKKNR